jgi:hypothetical protein
MPEQLKISRKNSRKNANKRKLLTAVFVAIILIIAVTLGYFIFANFAKNQTTTRIQQAAFDSDGVDTKPIAKSEIGNYHVAANYPKMLVIPSIGVNARMAPLGLLAPQNNSPQLDVPKNIYDTGWYDCTINPIAANKCSRKKLPNDGNFTTANLIDGHSCEGYNLPCVFNNLAKLKTDAQITVELGDGSKLNYVVKEVDVVPLAEVDMNKMMKPIGAGQDGVNLITCAGDWVAKDSRGHNTPDQRVEIYAIKQ